MEAVLAEDALTDFEVELGLRSPETTPHRAGGQGPGPGRDRQGRRETVELKRVER